MPLSAVGAAFSAGAAVCAPAAVPNANAAAMAAIAINDLIGAPIAISTSPRPLLLLNVPRPHENASLTSVVPECDDSGAECEARHSRPTGSALSVAAAGDCPRNEDRTMTTRRLVYWWFRIVISGRFLEKFLVRRAGPT